PYTTLFRSRRVTDSFQVQPEIVYAHFLTNALAVMEYTKLNNIPLIVASGESSYGSFDKLEEGIRSELFSQISHIICVSDSNKRQLIERGFDFNKISVIPNAVNYDLFSPIDKASAKIKLGIPTERFVVGFIGHFIHRKGPNRIIEAIKLLGDRDIQLVCVGGNGQLVENNFTLEIGPVPNYPLPEIYNVFDVFV